MTAEARAARDRLLNEVGQTGLDIAARALAEHPSAAALAAEFGEAGIAALARANGDPTVAARELVRRARFGRVQSRINISNAGFAHVRDRHFGRKRNASQFSISEEELRTLLTSQPVVSSPIVRTIQSSGGPQYVREILFSYPIGSDKFLNYALTNTLTVLCNEAGELVTAFPGILQ